MYEPERAGFEPEIEQEERGWSLSKRLVYGCISLLLALGLMASAISGAVWLWRRWQAASATEQRPPIVSEGRPATATPSSAEGEAADSSEDNPLLAPPDRTTEAPPPPSGVNRIVYVTNRGELATVDPAGENGRFLTDADIRFRFPAWSPDARRVAAIGNSRNGAGIYVLPDEDAAVDPESRYFSPRKTPIYFYWSPTGETVSFIANDEEGLALYLTPAAGGESRKIATGSPFYWDWFADGQRVLVHSDVGDETARLAVLSVTEADGAEEAVTAPGFFQSPAISDDGRYWAYASSAENGLSWITVRDTETGEEQRQRHAGVAAMGWRPGHNQLAVISGQPQSDNFYGPLRLLDAETGEQRLLTRNLVLAFFWSPDGRYLAYVSIPGQSDDSVAKNGQRMARGKTAVSLPRSAQNGFAHRFSLHLVDATTGRDRLLQSIHPTFSFLSQFLPFFDQYAHSHRLWAPDSTALVLPQRLEGENQVTVIPLDGGEARLIAEGDMPFWSP